MKYFVLYLPFIFSWMFLETPEISYFIAWIGSFLLILLVISGTIRPKGIGNPSWMDSPLRPLYIPYFIFSTYMTLSSIFYFWSLYGYVYLEKLLVQSDSHTFEQAANAQNIYVLGQAALLHGLILGYKYKPKSNLFAPKIKISHLTLQLALAFVIISLILKYFPQLSQLEERISRLSIVTSSASLAFAITKKNSNFRLISVVLFGYNFFQALLSGWKEEIIIPFILLGAFLLPVYKGKILSVMLPVFVALIFILPTFNIVFRNNVWDNGVNQQEALQNALKAVQEQNSLVVETNWSFLTNRMSEISLFIKYLDNVPRYRSFYHFQIIDQSLESLIPRILLPNKKATEEIVMNRVWENFVVERISIVSAKPQIIVDGYLSFGVFGAWLFCFIVGRSASGISVLSEKLFGSYFLGTGIIFSGLFYIYWRGNCLEFFTNNVAWSLVIMIIIYFSFQMLDLIGTRRT